MDFSDKQSGLSPAIGSSLSAGQSLLAFGKPILGTLEEPRVLNLLTIGGGEERFATDIYSDYLTGFRQWFQLDIIAGEEGEPFPGSTSANSDGFDSSLNKTGEAKFESADFVNGEILALQLPTRLHESKRIIAVSPFETRKPRLLTILHSAEETLVGFVQSLNDFLKNLRVHGLIFWERLLQIRQLFHLVKLRGGLARLLVGEDALFQEEIVEIAAEVKPTFGLFERQAVGFYSIFESLSHFFTKHSMSQIPDDVKPF